MVGFVASNIWQIWHPRHQQVFNQRDVTFDETLFYDPDLPLPHDIPIRLPPPMVEMIQLPPVIKEADAELSTEPSSEPLTEPDPEQLLEGLYDAEPLPIEQGQAPQEEAKTTDSVQNQPLTPEHTPLPESPRHEDPHERTVDIPGAFDSGPATPESTHLEPFFIPANNEVSSEENGANTEMTRLHGSYQWNWKTAALHQGRLQGVKQKRKIINNHLPPLTVTKTPLDVRVKLPRVSMKGSL